MKLYVIRHGHTDFNKEHRIQGIEFDEPLNETGVAEMHTILPNLPKDFEVIFSSPLKRVRSSAQIISDYSGKEIVIRNELNECDLGSLAGKTWDEMPDGERLHALHHTDHYDYRPFGGESASDVRDRVQVFLDDLKTMKYKAVLTVTSVGVIRMMYRILNHTEVIAVKNASVHEFQI